MSLRAELALDALEMAIFARGDPLPQLVHHSDRWNTRRLHEACGYRPPAEYEAAYHSLQATAEAA